MTIEAPADLWFWGTPQWRAYCDAYDGVLRHNFGEHGNLILPLASEAAMWKRVSKGHRADIKRGQATLMGLRTATNEHREQIEDVMFSEYMRLHRADVEAGGNTERPLETFRLMRQFIREGFGMLFLGASSAEPPWIGAAYFYTYRGRAYYGSAARDPALSPKVPVAHFLIWEAMRTLAELGYREIDMGPAPGEDAGPKEKSVAAFKHHFGAEFPPEVEGQGPGWSW